MVNKTTTAELIIKPIQFIEETVEGTVPGSGSTTAIGISSLISVKKDGQWVEVPQLGSEDLAGLTQGPQKFDFQLKYNPINSTFLKYGINSAVYATPTGTISKSLTLVFSAWLNGSENYIVFSGVKVSQVKYDREIGKPDVVTMDLKAMNIAVPSGSAPAGLTLVTAQPAGPAWDWLSGGANPVTDGGTGQDCRKFSLTINRNTKEDWTLGNLLPFGLQPHGRRISFNADLLWDATSTAEADYTNAVARTLIMTLKTAVSVLTLSNAYKTNYNRDEDIGSGMTVVETITGKSLTCGVT